MLTIDPKAIAATKMHSYLLGAVTPRPIAFASTIDREGNVNLSPFSFFNCFGANPPVLIFSPARRGRDNTTKHTYENLRDVPEAVINVVTWNMVHQTSLASTEFPRGVNEFEKAGFSEVASVLVKPPRVGESPVAMECKVLQIIQTGDQPAAGNLVICQVVLMHISEAVLDAQGRIDPFRLDAVARLGGDYYCRVQGDSIFRIPRPSDKTVIGIDQLPQRIRNSAILTGNDLGMLANVERMPDPAPPLEFQNRPEVIAARKKGDDALHRLAHEYLAEGKVAEAWNALALSRDGMPDPVNPGTSQP